MLRFPGVSVLKLPFTVEIIPRNPPFFEPKLEGFTTIQMTRTSESWSYKLPLIKPDSSTVILTVDFGYAGNFLYLDDKNL
jgi:hypothetical protein